MCPTDPIPDSLPRSLASQGNAGDINAWSGTSYFFFNAARRIGFLTHALDLTDPTYPRRRLLWHATAPLRLERPGGYQYSRVAMERIWDLVPPDLRRGEIISHYQVFPPLDRAASAGVRHSFYCDATLAQLFGATGTWSQRGDRVGWRTKADALRREGELYRSARFCVAMSRSTAESFVHDYHVDPAKTYVVRPGANLDEGDVVPYLLQRGPSWRERPEPFSRGNPARLGFIGRDYLRKGLPRLVDAADILHARGRSVLVSVIGHCPEHLRQHPRVEWVGFIHKGQEPRRFLSAVDRFALGCLPSYAEPLGISTLECLRLGIPVMGAAVGGIPDCVPPEGGFLVDGSATAGDIADAIEGHVFDPDRYRGMVTGAVAAASGTTWATTVAQFQTIWEGGGRPYQDPVSRQVPNSAVPGAGFRI